MRDKKYSNLKDCYSAQAEHFGHTRKKHWPELQYILQEIKTISITKSLVTILELGCGTGRKKLFDDMTKILDKKNRTYTGIDNASGMINQAKKQPYNNIKNITFICADMIDYLKTLEDESLDVVLGIASVQHLTTRKQRLLLWQEIYRVLKRKGKVVFINWSYSQRFLKKYRKYQIRKRLLSLFSLEESSRNDIIIPWKDPGFQQNKKIRQRYYHIFTQHELEQISKLSGFVIEKNTFVQQHGTLHKDNWKNSRNTLLVIRKDVIH